MGHAARRRARAQERAHGVRSRAECLSEAWLQSGEGGGDGLEALWGGSYGVETLDGQRACCACLRDRIRKSHYCCPSWLFSVQYVYCFLVSRHEIQLQAIVELLRRGGLLRIDEAYVVFGTLMTMTMFAFN